MMNPAALLKEPLMHFVVLGAALFLIHSIVREDAGPDDTEIVVTAGLIQHLATVFERTWQRPPTRPELQGLIDDHIREEIAYREGMAIGLDTDDVIVRRRIRQKLEFVAEDLAASVEPTDEELAAYLREHAEVFRTGQRRDFRQVFLGTETTDARAADDLRQQLNQNPLVDARGIGEPTLLDHAYADQSERAIASQFGRDFAQTLATFETGRWFGPIRSGFGEHLVIIDAQRGGELPELNVIRDRVMEEWHNERQIVLVNDFYNGLLDAYTITIEWPDQNDA